MKYLLLDSSMGLGWERRFHTLKLGPFNLCSFPWTYVVDRMGTNMVILMFLLFISCLLLHTIGAMVSPLPSVYIRSTVTPLKLH